MTIFDYVTATLLIVLGLGATELLIDAVSLFRVRRTQPPEWISLAWAGIIFSFQMQFIWAVFELDSLVSAWSALMFIVALLLALLLFAAGAVVIPRPAPNGTWDPWQRFIDNGRWSVMALSVYSLIAFLANPMFFGIGMLSSTNVPNLILTAVFLGVFFLRSKKQWAWATAAAAIYSAYTIIELSPSTYS